MSALRNRDFRLLWSARLASQLGSWLLVVAVPAYVFTLTSSVAATGLTLAAQFLPPVLLGPIAGVLADRCDRRRVMIAADLGRAATVAVLVLVRDPGDLWFVYLALTLESVGTVAFRPAAQAHTPAVVGTGAALSSANALNVGTDGMVRLIGAPLGGVLFAWAGFDLLVWLDTGTYLLSAALIPFTAPLTARIQPGAGGRPVRTQPGAGRLLGDLRAGLAFLLTNRTARTLLLVNTLFLGANAGLSALLIPYGIAVLGGSGPVGLLMSALGAGFLLGAPLMRLLVERAPPGHLLGGALAITGCGYVRLFSAGTLTVALPAAVLIGMTGSVALGDAQTTLQRVTPGHLLGRTSAAMFTGEAAATFAGALIGPAVAQVLSVTVAAVLAGAVTVLSGAVAGVAGLRDRRRTSGGHRPAARSTAVTGAERGD